MTKRMTLSELRQKLIARRKVAHLAVLSQALGISIEELERRGKEDERQRRLKLMNSPAEWRREAYERYPRRG